MKLTQSRQTSKASNTHKSIATRLLRIMILWSNGRATAEHSVLQAFFRHRTATTERQRRFCPHLSLATVRESWQCDPDRLRTAFSCRVSTNERSTGRDSPRTSAILRTLASHAASPGLPQARMPGSVPVTPSDISIIRLQVGEEPEWCDLLQEAREKKE